MGVRGGEGRRGMEEGKAWMEGGWRAVGEGNGGWKMK